MDPVTAVLLGGSAVGGLASVLGQSSANRANVQLSREQMEQQYKMFQEANAFNHQERLETQDYNRNMWYEQQKYNSPFNQSQRLALAGVNPAQVLGGNAAEIQGSIPASSPASSSGVPSVSPAHVDNLFGSAFSNSIGVLSDLMLKKEQVQGMAIDNEYRAREHIVSIDKQLAEKEGLLSSSKLSQASRERIYEEIDNLKIERQLSQNMVDRISVTNQQTDEMFQRSIRHLDDEHEQSLLNREALKLSNKIQQTFGLKMAERQYYQLGIACQHALAEIGLIGSQTHLTDKQVETEVSRCTEQVLKNVQIKHDTAHYPQLRKLINDELRAKIRQSNSSAALSEFGVSAGGLALKAAPWLIGGAASFSRIPKVLRTLKLKYGKGKVDGNTITW